MTTPLTAFESHQKDLEALGFQKIWEKKNPYFQISLLGESDSEKQEREQKIETFQIFYHPEKHIFSKVSSFKSTNYNGYVDTVVNETSFFYTLKGKSTTDTTKSLAFKEKNRSNVSYRDADGSLYFVAAQHNESLEKMTALFKSYEKHNYEFVPLKTQSLNPGIPLEYFTDSETAHTLWFGEKLANKLFNPGTNKNDPYFYRSYLKDILKVKKAITQANNDWQEFLTQLPLPLSEQLGYLKAHENHAQRDINNASNSVVRYYHLEKKNQTLNYKIKKKNKDTPKVDKILNSNFYLEKETPVFLHDSSYYETAKTFHNKGLRLHKKDKLIAGYIHNAMVESARAKALHLNPSRIKTYLDNRISKDLFQLSFEHEAYSHINFFNSIQLIQSPKVLNYWYEKAQTSELKKPFLEKTLLSSNYVCNYRVDISGELKLTNFQFLFFDGLSAENSFTGAMAKYFPTQLNHLLSAAPLVDIPTITSLFKSGDYDINFYVDNLIYLDKKGFFWWGSDKLSDKKEKLQELLEFLNDYKAQYAPDLDTPQKLEVMIITLDKEMLNQEIQVSMPSAPLNTTDNHKKVKMKI